MTPLRPYATRVVPARAARGSPSRMPVAIVTGGNSGIGRACAVALARRGFDLGITWHADEEHLESVVTELSGSGARVEARRADFEQHGADAVIDELAGMRWAASTRWC